MFDLRLNSHSGFQIPPAALKLVLVLHCLHLDFPQSVTSFLVIVATAVNKSVQIIVLEIVPTSGDRK